MMSDFVLSVDSITERDDRQFLAWANSLRRDLETLGLTRIESQAPSLAEYIDLQGEAAP